MYDGKKMINFITGVYTGVGGYSEIISSFHLLQSKVMYTLSGGVKFVFAEEIYI